MPAIIGHHSELSGVFAGFTYQFAENATQPSPLPQGEGIWAHFDDYKKHVVHTTFCGRPSRNAITLSTAPSFNSSIPSGVWSAICGVMTT